jgi:hypothetical protein
MRVMENLNAVKINGPVSVTAVVPHKLYLPIIMR